MAQVIAEDGEGSHKWPTVGMQLGWGHVDLGE